MPLFETVPFEQRERFATQERRMQGVETDVMPDAGDAGSATIMSTENQGQQAAASAPMDVAVDYIQGEASVTALVVPTSTSMPSMAVQGEASVPVVPTSAPSMAMMIDGMSMKKVAPQSIPHTGAGAVPCVGPPKVSGSKPPCRFKTVHCIDITSPQHSVLCVGQSLLAVSLWPLARWHSWRSS